MRQILKPTFLKFPQMKGNFHKDNSHGDPKCAIFSYPVYARNY